jgi:hypothetical protein
MEIKLIYSQPSSKNDGKSYINTQGDKILLVSQNDYKTIQIIDVQSDRCLWYINIKGKTIHARPSIDFETVIISYINTSIGETNSKLYIIECKWKAESIKTLLVKDNIDGIYSSSLRYLSYCKDNNNYILTLDKNYFPLSESSIIGIPYDLYNIHNGIVYLKYSLIFNVPYVSLVYAKYENVVNIPFGQNDICYMSITRHPIKNVTWLVVTINNSKLSTQIRVYKVKETVELKYTDDISGMTNTTYAYINDEGNKILVSGTQNKINIINVYNINKDPPTYGLSIRRWNNKVYKTIQSLPKGYWVLNQSLNFNNIILTNSEGTKDNVIVMSQIDTLYE